LAPTSAVFANLHCAEPVVEVGVVRSGAQLHHDFTFVNRGPAPVEVRQLRPSCGCLTPHLDRMVLAPGESASLRLEVNTLTQAAGLETWRVTVRYRTGGEEQELTVGLCGRVVTELAVEPAALEVSTTGAFSRTVTLTDGRAQPLTVTSVRTTAPQLRAVLSGPGTDAAGRRTWTVRLDVGDDLPVGRRQEGLLLTTSDPAYPELKILVAVEKRPRLLVRAAPEAIEWTATPGQVASRVVLLRGSDDDPVEVEAIECDAPGVRGEWTPGPGLSATLRVTIDADRLSVAGGRGEVRVRFAHPAGQVLTVPVACAMRGGAALNKLANAPFPGYD
jgi:hypothetical protein